MFPTKATTLPAAILLTCPGTAPALDIRVYDSADHDRFTGFPATPAANPGQLFASTDTTGIGWFAPNPDVQFALVSRQHVLFATHFLDPVGPNQVRFVNASGSLVTRTLGAETIISQGGQPSDLAVITLSSPIDEAEGVTPLPYLDLAGGNDYEGLVIGVAGQAPVEGNSPVIGRDTIDDVENNPREADYGAAGMLTTRYFRFNYNLSGGGLGNDEGFFEPGDSGSPSFVDTGGRAALVGIHSYVTLYQGPGPDAYRNYDVFVPHYITELDAILAPAGFRMRPVNAPSTTLSGATATAEATPRQAMPLTLEFTIGNTGGETTGNLEVAFEFAGGEEPDSVSAPGWVTYGGGGSYTLRRATMNDGESDVIEAHWSAAPVLATIEPDLTWRSDTVADQSSSPVIALGPSYAAWADGLAEPETTDDPDADGLVNLLEYALGGDPESGLQLLPNGDPARPVLTVSAGTATFSYPERDDAAARGLDYSAEFSDNLESGSWTTTPPPGLVTGTAAHVPAVPGFVRRSLSWPVTGDATFVRLVVTLDE